MKDLIPKMSICVRILLGRVHHRKPMNFADYINGDKKYVLEKIASWKKVNFLSLLFQYLGDIVKEPRDGSKKKRNWIPLRRLISDILMESKLIDSLTGAQKTKELISQVGKVFNSRSLKNMGIIYELKRNLAEVSKEVISIRRILVEDFLIFIMQDPMHVLIDYLDKYQTGAQNKASEILRKRKSSKKHSNGTSKRVKTSNSAMRTLDTSIEEPRAAGATPSAGTVSRRVHHRKPMNFADYINGDKKYVLEKIASWKKVNFLSLLFQYLGDIVKEPRDGSKKKRNWIPLRRLISDILMESKLIDSLTGAQKTKELISQVGKVFNSRSLKNMGIIYELKRNLAEVSKEVISIRRILVEDFLIFIMQDPMHVLIDYLDKYQTGAQNKASEILRKRKSSKKHSNGTSKRVKTSNSAMRTLDTSIEEPRAAGATPSAGTVSTSEVNNDGSESKVGEGFKPKQSFKHLQRVSMKDSRWRIGRNSA
ncbi:hypothetical protein KIW84_043955 [Lathyrus oleraceus]|uniref:Uncharacterized protein n=1 Tax=Pisum sativum TaxID=3888 RepID=A0A9D5APR5_PEA|nr:hypothetical protein KIW84_043955 [Pisum sativum]